MGRICGKCSKTYSSRQSLYNHRKYCAASLARKISEKTKVRRKLFIDSFKNDYGKSDIPTFDGAEFIGKKPKSDATLLNLMKVLRIPHEYRARDLKEEKEYDRKRFANSRTAESEQKGMNLIGCCK